MVPLALQINIIDVVGMELFNKSLSLTIRRSHGEIDVIRLLCGGLGYLTNGPPISNIDWSTAPV